MKLRSKTIVPLELLQAHIARFGHSVNVILQVAFLVLWMPVGIVLQWPLNRGGLGYINLL